MTILWQKAKHRRAMRTLCREKKAVTVLIGNVRKRIHET